jgi:hypothetical protein
MIYCGLSFLQFISNRKTFFSYIKTFILRNTFTNKTLKNIEKLFLNLKICFQLSDLKIELNSQSPRGISPNVELSYCEVLKEMRVKFC